jgi:hypothetical protein
MNQSPTKLSRRVLFAGAGTAGAIATVASLMPSVQSVALPAAPQVKPAPENGGGYFVSAHVKQYYKTTLV